MVTMDEGTVNGRPVGTVAGVNRYPVKSLQGETLDEGHLGAIGLDGDRHWGIVHTETGHVLTAKRVGALLDASARLTPEGPVLELPDGGRLDGPGDATDRALSEWLGLPVSLRAAGEEAITYEMSFDVDDPDHDMFQWPTPPGSFLDLAPVHLLTTTSIAAAAAGHPAGDWRVQRFRPTILLDTDAEGNGSPGFVENDWVGRSVAIGGAIVSISMPTIRCSLPTKAQAPHGIERDLQIFKSLAAHNNQNLGAYATVTTPGTIRIGDTAILLDA